VTVVAARGAVVIGSVRPVLSIEVPADAVVPERHPKAPVPGDRIPVHNPQCRGCADVPGSLHIRSWADEGLSVRSVFTIREEHQGAPGIVHGGLLMTAFDECLGTTWQLVLRAAVTARMETDFRRPIPVGTDLWLRGRVDGVAGRKIYTSGTAHLDDPDGPVAGTARALFVQVGREHFLKHGRPEDLEAAGAPAEAIRAARA
jgi:acyl-coenzyme A thioesterase PaaI-like protein